MMKKTAGLVLGVALGLAGSAAADHWDRGADPDNGNGTDNTPFHGSEQVHDLAVQPGSLETQGSLPDEDWFLLGAHARSSYQFVVDGLTGDLDLTSTDVQLVSSNGSVLASAVASDGVLSLIWLESSASGSRFVRVSGAGCATSCDETDRYTARFYDTTATIPRFNDSGTQSTALLLQNATNRNCILHIFFLDVGGQQIGPVNLVGLAAHELRVFTSGLTNQSGSVRIAHGCGYGGLSGKAVSIEPATGFTFDTPLLYRPR
jgi:hypothetical protein